jgi:putative endonuclease
MQRSCRPGTYEHRHLLFLEMFVVLGSGPGPYGPSRNDEYVDAMPFYVYLLASRRHGTLYLGVTNDLIRRVHQHKTASTLGFTSRYGVDRVVWFEPYDDPTNAISREKELKKWRRDWKIRLIEEQNPDWRDLHAACSNNRLPD